MGGNKSVKQANEINKGMQLRKSGFVEMQNESSNEEDDFKPVIVGEDFGINLKSEADRKQILSGRVI